jgi:transposase
MSKAALGIDIAKEKFDVSLRKEGKFRDQSFQNDKAGFEKLMKWLTKQAIEQVHACMEATGNYGEELALFLQSRGQDVSVVNPASIKHYGKSKLSRNKTDKNDAHLIALYCENEKPYLWEAPPIEVRQLQALTRHLDSLEQILVQERTRLGVAKESLVINSLQGHVSYLEVEIKKLKAQINAHIDNHPQLKNNRELLVSIPGIGQATANKLMAEIPDLKKYASARQLAAQAGVTPSNHESGKSVKKQAELSKLGSSRLRELLYFPAVTAKRHNPVVKDFSQRLAARGKKPMQIIGAAMRKLIHIIYGVLKHQRAFDPNYAH